MKATALLENFIRRHAPLCCLLISIAAACIYVTSVPLSNSDVQDFLHPWRNYIVSHGRWASMGEEFANYTPPYLYVLSLTTLVDGLPAIAQIKLGSWIGTAFLCACCYYVFRYFYDQRLSAVSASFMAVTPTAILNGAVWGQCDAFYTASLVLVMGFALRDRWALAMAAFGLALSFKLQAIFIAPALSVFLLDRKIRVWMTAIPLLAYYLMMLPAIIAGRSIQSVSLVYFQQFETFKWLAPGAPNLWTLIQNILRKLSIQEVDYNFGVIAGISLATIASLAILIFGKLDPMNRTRLMTTFMVSAISIPYFLPKMHDRYFFAADILTIVCAICSRSMIFIFIAISVQLASFLACLGTPFGYYIGSAYGSVSMSIALALIWYAFICQKSPDLRSQNSRMMLA